MTNQMTNPISEQSLILFYYKDGLSKSERSEIESALHSDDSLRLQYEALTRDLDALDKPDDLPVPEGFEYRLQSSLERAVRLEESNLGKASWLQRFFTSQSLASS